MKSKILVLGLILAIVVVGNDTYAQLSKKEKKEWKKKKKSMSPDAFKSMVEENSTLKGQLSNLNKEVTTLESGLQDKDKEVSQLENKARRLESDLAATKKQLAEKPEAAATPDSGGDDNRMIPGVVFKVQIGAFRNKDLSKYFEKNKNFTGEEEEGVQKYSLGQFTDYWEADTFKKYLREMGVKDAWIVSYKDGVRVPLKDVLEGVI
jgi:CRISPR/Cas system CSM-associated protein Csm4 (group 5 of RAMP superfamily)